MLHRKKDFFPSSLVRGVYIASRIKQSGKVTELIDGLSAFLEERSR